MDRRLRWVWSRMTRPRLALLAVIAASPLVIAAVLIVGLVLNRPTAATVVVLAILAADVLVLGAAALFVLRRLRRVRAVLDGESIEFGRPSARIRSRDPLVAGWTRSRRIADGLESGIPADVVAAFGMATRSPFAREHIAGLATAWRFGAAELETLFATTADVRSLAAALGPVDVPTLLLLARTVASNGGSGEAFADAVVRFVAADPRADGLPLTAQHWLLERLVIAGDLDAAARRLDGANATTHSQLIAVDVLNPFLPGARERDAAPWLAAFGSLFRRAGLEVPVLKGGSAAPLDRLTTEPAAAVDGPLITVVMSAFRPGPDALRAAIDSLIAQSWRNWELLLIDDGSPDAAVLFAEIAARDERIRLLSPGANAGTYHRRNEALGDARGEFVTMHDADDWMHPRRLEVQARHLLEHPRLLANVCRSARVTPELRFAQPRGTLLRLTESSLLFRRAETVERVGYFDDVRKGADTGFRLRIEAVTGAPVELVDVEAPLVLSRFEESSLSGGELRDGWTHPARVAYSSAHASWLRERLSAGEAPRIAFPLIERPFPAPARILGMPAAHVSLDLLVVLDLRHDPARRRAQREEERMLQTAVAAGLRVGVRRLERLGPRGLGPLARAGVQSLVNADRLTDVLPDDEVVTRVLLVPDRRVLIAADDVSPGILAERVVILNSEESRRAAAFHEAALEGLARLVRPSKATVHAPLERLAPDALPSLISSLGRPVAT